MQTTIIRNYNRQDFNQIRDLLFDFQLHESSFESDNSKRPFQSKIEAENYLQQVLNDVETMEGILLVAQNQDLVIGFIYAVVVTHKNDQLHQLSHFSGREGWIGVVFVSPKHQRSGIGQELVSKAKDHLKKQNCQSVRLIVDSQNNSAINFYSQHGFSEYEKKLLLSL